MTSKQIETKQSTEARKVELRFGTAKAIRELLDAARKQYGTDDWDGDDCEATVLELVTEDG